MRLIVSEDWTMLAGKTQQYRDENIDAIIIQVRAGESQKHVFLHPNYPYGYTHASLDILCDPQGLRLLRGKDYKEIEVLYLQRASWLNGSKKEKMSGFPDDEPAYELQSFLYRSDTKMKCCLGFMGEQSGIDLGAMKDMGTPHALRDELRARFPLSLWRNVSTLNLPNASWARRFRDSSVEQLLMAINDDLDITNKEREKRLRAVLKSLGIKLRFKS